ncbi:GNAT family N-acetyltransferase [Streptomyces minutiscleroticus]|nr:GNAT family N-acetyltransferase [Streptomyces minutiscleroticus]
MTTTLRPTEPLQRAADGTLSRHYNVCVNSRPVGAIHLATRPGTGPSGSVAEIRALSVDEPDRRRGRATVAALAAEEVARGWGCRRIEASVPAAAEGALGLATVLGYVLRNRGMEKKLGAVPPALPEGSRPRPMTEEEYSSWYAATRESYARSWIERGVPEAEAYAKAQRDHERLLPQGPATEGTRLAVLEHGGEPVGLLWLAPRDGVSFVYKVETYPRHRGRGHGRTLMRLAERLAAEEGLDRVGLNVFAGNTAAERLYESLGYETVVHHLYKPL